MHIHYTAKRVIALHRVLVYAYTVPCGHECLWQAKKIRGSKTRSRVRVGGPGTPKIRSTQRTLRFLWTCRQNGIGRRRGGGIGQRLDAATAATRSTLFERREDGEIGQRRLAVADAQEGTNSLAVTDEDTGSVFGERLLW